MHAPPRARPWQSRPRRAGDEPSRPAAGGLISDETHLSAIERSHERCVTLGVSQFDAPDFSTIARNELTLVRDRNRRLHDHAAPVMAMLHEQIVNTESMVVLTDATGTIIHSIGDDDFLEKASKVALKPGANWSEHAKGTNAVGTALVEETPTLVHADEHYLHANHFLTCSAAPILDPRGNILGVLDVSGDFRSYHQHTLALVKMSARMIENRWLGEDFRHLLRLHFHSRGEFIGTLMEGILAVGTDGRIVGANRGALEQLGMSGAALRMHTLTTLFGTTVGALVDHFRSALATPISLALGNGRQFMVSARFNWPVWSTLGEQQTGAPMNPAAPRMEDVRPAPVTPASSPAPARKADATQTQGSALAHLRTGDAQVDVVVDKIRRVLDRDIPILILGETGTGKELLARAIHTDSARGKQPFVAVNCASIPDTLIEAELFGYEDGAFTGARRKGSPGKIVQANGGTLFLDEIGDMPVALQAHLLRVLQERQVTPLGSSKSVAVDVTIICATHRNLREMISRQAFREDLFYRLNGLAVRLPALRERTDLMALVRRILERECGGRRLHLDADVVRMFEGYQWPGNVRQLFNVLRTACVMAAGESTITRSHLSDDFLEDAQRALQARAVQAPAAEPAPPAAGMTIPPAGPAAQGTPAAAAVQGAATEPVEGLPQTLGDLEIEVIRRTVESLGGNISEASKRLGISRNTIYRKLRWNQPHGG